MRRLAWLIVLVVACHDDTTRCATCSAIDAAIDGPACTVGMHCGNDCTEFDDSCWACGELSYNASCACRPTASTCYRPDCSAMTPGAVGDYCGTAWWCNRGCSVGLTCKKVPDNLDPNGGGPLSFLKTCQP